MRQKKKNLSQHIQYTVPKGKLIPDTQYISKQNMKDTER